MCRRYCITPLLTNNMQSVKFFMKAPTVATSISGMYCIILSIKIYDLRFTHYTIRLLVQTRFWSDLVSGTPNWSQQDNYLATLMHYFMSGLRSNVYSDVYITYWVHICIVFSEVIFTKVQTVCRRRTTNNAHCKKQYSLIIIW